MANRERSNARVVGEVTRRDSTLTAHTPAATKRKSLGFGVESVNYTADTEIEQETFSFLWNIKNYSGFDGSEDTMSPTFLGGPKSKHTWQMKMCPKKKSDEQEFFAVHLILAAFGPDHPSPDHRVKTRFQVTILDRDGKVGKQAGSLSMNPCQFRKQSVWGYDKFVLSSDLVAPARRLVVDDVLRIHCRVWIEGAIIHYISNGGATLAVVSQEERIKKSKERVAHDVGKLFNNASLTDVAIATSTSTWFVHKAVLAARSPAFAAMFSLDMLEKECSTMEIKDFEDNIIEGMLQYIYGGATEALAEKAPDLLMIAEKYDVSGLKEECEELISEQLAVDNAAQVLVLAHLFNAPKLKSVAMDFIKDNKEEMKKKKTFKDAAKAHPSLFLEMYMAQ